MVMMFPQSRGGPYRSSGVIASNLVPGENTAPKSKLLGRTPITVVCLPFMSNALPTIAGSAPNCLLHHESLSSTTGGAPSRASSGVNVRPRAACTPQHLEEIRNHIHAGCRNRRSAQAERSEEHTSELQSLR